MPAEIYATIIIKYTQNKFVCERQLGSSLPYATRAFKSISLGQRKFGVLKDAQALDYEYSSRPRSISPLDAPCCVPAY